MYPDGNNLWLCRARLVLCHRMHRVLSGLQRGFVMCEFQSCATTAKPRGGSTASCTPLSSMGSSPPILRICSESGEVLALLPIEAVGAPSLEVPEAMDEAQGSLSWQGQTAHSRGGGFKLSQFSWAASSAALLLCLSSAAKPPGPPQRKMCYSKTLILHYCAPGCCK